MNTSQEHTNKYKVNYSKEDIIESCVREWVLEWCEKHNSEVFERAREYILLSLKNESIL